MTAFRSVATLEAAVGLGGRPREELGLLGVGLGLSHRPGLDRGIELGLAVRDESVDDDLDVDVVGRRDLGDGLAALERRQEVGLADADRLGDDRGVADGLIVAAALAAVALEAAVGLVGRPREELGLLGVGLGLSHRPGL